MFLIKHFLRLPQLRVCRDPCSIKGRILGHRAVVPAHLGHLFSQSLFRLEHPPLIGCPLYGLGSFLDHLGLCLGLSNSAFKLRIAAFSMARSSSVVKRHLRWSSTWASVVLSPARVLWWLCSEVLSFSASWDFSSLIDLSVFSTSRLKLDSASNLLWALLTHSSATKTYWVTCTKQEDYTKNTY